MRHKFFLWFLLLLIAQTVGAQLPEVSTSDAPIWYYIQVKGDGDRVDRVFTSEEGTKVSGRSLINTTDAAAVATQLWRFEGTNSALTIINKATGKCINLAFDPNREIGIASLSADESVNLQLIQQGNYFQIKSSTPAPGGVDDELFFHQANSGGSRDYCIMLVGASYADSENSLFSFVLFEDFTIEYSNDAEEHWYHIASGKDNYRTKVLSETVDPTAGQPFILKALDPSDYTQQWKMIKMTDGKIQFVNRSSRHTIETRSIAQNGFNVTQAGADDTQGNGWSLTYLGSGQYTIGGIEEDGLSRFLHASMVDTQPDKFDPKTSKGTSYSWQFKKVDELNALKETSINNLRITVEDGRIFVEGRKDFKVFTLKGNPMPNNSRLASGVYLVTVGEQSSKVIVN